MSGLLIAILTVPAVGAIAAVAVAMTIADRRLAGQIATAASFATLTLAAVLALAVRRGSSVEAFGWLRADALSAVEIALAAAVATAVAVFQSFDRPAGDGLSDPDDEHGAAAIAAVAPGANLALLAAACAAFLVPDLASLCAALWLAAIASATLLASDATRATVRSAWTLLVFSTIGLGLALLGALTLDAGGARLELSGLAQGSAPPAAIELGYALALVGFATTAAAPPLNRWLTAAHDSARFSTLAAIAGVTVNASLYAALRLHAALAAPLAGTALGGAMLAIGLGAAVLGACGMLLSSSRRRLVARATAGSVGLVLFAGAAGPVGATAACALIITHTMARVALLLASTSTAADGERSAASPGPASIPVAIALVVLIGLPPSGVFAGQLSVLEAALGRGSVTFAVVLAVLLATGTALVRGYRERGHDDRQAGGGPRSALPLPGRAAIVLLLTVPIAAGVAVPTPVAELLRTAAAAISGTTTGATTADGARGTR